MAGHGALRQAVAAGVCRVACRVRLIRPAHCGHPCACACPHGCRWQGACSAAAWAVKALTAGHGSLAAVINTPNAFTQPAPLLRLQSDCFACHLMEQCRGGVHKGWQVTFVSLLLGDTRNFLCQSTMSSSEGMSLALTLMAMKGVGVAVQLLLVKGLPLLGVEGAPPAFLGRVKELLHRSTERL